MILNLAQVKTIINKSGFASELKDRLFLILPNLGRNTLTRLGLEIERHDSNLISRTLVNVWENYSKILQELLGKNTLAENNFLTALQNMEVSLNEERKLYFLSLVLDVRVLADSKKLTNVEVFYKDILEYEISMFWFLDKDEVVYILQKHLLLLESRVNLLNHIQVAVWEYGWHFEKDFSNFFSDLLAKNFDFLGAGVKLSVGDWVKKYFDSSSSNVFRTDTVQIAEFLTKNPLVQKLSEGEKQTLSEILKLYVWFLKPSFNEEQILQYKEEVRAHQIKELEKQFPEMSTENNSIATDDEDEDDKLSSVSVSDASPKFVKSIPIDGIDQKLEDLKKRLGK